MAEIQNRPFLKLCLAFSLLVVLSHATEATVREHQSNLTTQDKSNGIKGIIFDVTRFTEGNDYNNRGIHKSPLVYIVENDNVYNDTCTIRRQTLQFKCGPHFAISSLSLLISDEKIQDVADLETRPLTPNTIPNLINNVSIINSVIISLRPTGGRCSLDLLATYLSSELNVIRSNTTFSGAKLGLEYDGFLLEDCTERSEADIFTFVDLVVFRLDISPLTTLLSYGLFSSKLDVLVQKHEEHLQRINPECKLYFRVVFKRDTTLFSEQVNDRYEFLMYQYVKEWKEEHHTSQTIFVMPSFPLNVSVPDNTQFLRTSVDSKIDLTAPETSSLNWIKGIPQFFENITIKINEFCDYVPDVGSWISANLGPTSSFSKANLSLWMRWGKVPISCIMDLVKRSDLLNIHTIYLMEYQISEWTTAELNGIINLMKSRNMQIGCYLYLLDHFVSKFDSSVILTNIRTKCGRILNISSKILFHARMIETGESFLELLWRAEYARGIIGAEFPWAMSIPFVEVRWNPQHREVSDEASVFCSKDKQNCNEHINAILTHANINGWPNSILGHQLNTNDWLYLSKNWWQNILTSDNINRTITDFSVFVRTNEAKTMKNDIPFPNKYPCINWKPAPPDTGIDFLNTSYSGTTVVMDLNEGRPLKVRELETLILFAFGKFPTVELVAQTEDDIMVAADVSSGKILEAVRKANNMSSESQLVYLELPLELAYYSKAISKLSSNVAVHLSGWENHTLTLAKTFNVISAKHSRLLGLTVANCADELNLNLTRLTAFPFLKYVVCNMSPFQQDSSNRTWMDIYLSTMFYIKTYMQKFLPERSPHISNLDVIFRLNFKHEKICTANQQRVKVDEFLRFVNAIQQHGSTYKMRYFIVNAFRKEGSTENCPNSWWRIKNYTDLSITSVYTDIEEEHFRRPTLLKLEIPLDELSSTTSTSFNAYLVVITSVLFFLLMLCAIAFRLYHNRMRKKIVSQEEIIEFYNGVKNNNSDEYQEDNSKWLGLGFPEHFQIQKERIELGRLIGAGEYGEVFIGMLDKETDVAIKVPKPNASVETFKSALVEVKILLYVGDGCHPNVISFLGAYTKEISSGKLYILTEYCHKGSLFDYLKATKAEIRRGENTVDLNQLYRFAFEIASGMEYVSEKSVIHGDLATRNVLLSSDFTCKISDFGLSRKLYDYTKYVKKTQQPLPWRWMAVESLKDREFTTKSDVWGYGVTAWEIFSLGGQPYPGLAWTPGFANELITGMRLEKADYASDIIHEKLLECWSVCPEERPTFGELAQYFVELRNDAYTNCVDVAPTNSAGQISGDVEQSGMMDETTV